MRICLCVWYTASVQGAPAAAYVRLAVLTPDQLFCKLSSLGWTNLLAALGLGESWVHRSGAGLEELLLPLWSACVHRGQHLWPLPAF